MKPSKSPKAVRPRKMYLVTRENGAYTSIGRTKSECGYSDASPVLLLSLTPASKAAYVEAIKRRWMKPTKGYNILASVVRGGRI
jgi:hypothetical protein